MWQEIAVFAIVGGATWNLWRTFRGTLGDKSSCGGGGCGKCPSNSPKSPAVKSEAPLIQIQMNGRALQVPTNLPPRDKHTISRN